MLDQCTCMQYYSNKIILYYYYNYVQIKTGGQCVENSIRLVGEVSQNEGLVTICLGGTWGKVCYVGSEEATVVCRQLGFSTDGDVFD